MTLGEKLHKLRKRKGLSQEDIASQITVSRQAVSKWELNETVPDIDNLIQLSKILEVSVDFLLNEELNEVADIPVVKQSVREERKKLNTTWCIGVVVIIAILILIGSYVNSLMTILTLLFSIGVTIFVIKLFLFYRTRKRRGTRHYEKNI